jgi:hypothetical protein
MDRVFPESQLRCFVSGHDFQSGRKGPTKIRALAPGLFSGSSGAQAPNMLRERASLHEGHGFSRAIKGLPTTALAAEVRFSTHSGNVISLRGCLRRRRLERRTSEAKALIGRVGCGTAEPVPFVDQHTSKKPVVIETATDQRNQPDFVRPSSTQSNQHVTSSENQLFR